MPASEKPSTRDSLKRWGALLAVVLGVFYALPPAPEREVVIRYVDEDGNTVSKERADAYFAERARLEAIEREALRKYAAEKATNAPRSAPISYSWSPAEGSTGRSVERDGLTAIGSRPERVHVNGYQRRDGTYVREHYRSAGNSTERDNWSSKGNSNPVTGQQGSRKARR